jgi:hypothetical protein
MKNLGRKTKGMEGKWMPWAGRRYARRKGWGGKEGEERRRNTTEEVIIADEEKG